jgi:hypothetical protein
MTETDIWTEFSTSRIHARCDVSVCKILTTFPKTNKSVLTIEQRGADLKARCGERLVELPPFLDVTIVDSEDFCTEDKNPFWSEMYRRMSSIIPEQNSSFYRATLSRYEGLVTHTADVEMLSTRSKGSCVYLERGNNYPHIKMCPLIRIRVNSARSDENLVGSRIEAEILPPRKERMKPRIRNRQKLTKIQVLMSAENIFMGQWGWKMYAEFIKNDEFNCDQTQKLIEYFLDVPVKTLGVYGNFVTDDTVKLACAISWAPVDNDLTITYIPRKNLFFIHHANTKFVGEDSFMKVEDGFAYLKCWGGWVPYEYFSLKRRFSIQTECFEPNVEMIESSNEVYRIQWQQKVIEISSDDSQGMTRIVIGPDQIMESFAAPVSIVTLQTKRMQKDMLKIHSDMSVQYISERTG